MKKVEFCLDTGFAGVSIISDVIEFDDDVTEKEIGECFEDWKDNLFDSYWDYVNE